MTTNDIATEVASELASTFGPGLKTATQEALEGKAAGPTADASGKITRGIFTQPAEIAVIAQLIVSMVPIAAAAWSQHPDRGAVKDSARQAAQQSADLDPDLVERVVNAVVDKISQRH